MYILTATSQKGYKPSDTRHHHHPPHQLLSHKVIRNKKENKGLFPSIISYRENINYLVLL